VFGRRLCRFCRALTYQVNCCKLSVVRESEKNNAVSQKEMCFQLSASRQKPSRSLQGIPGAASFRGALLLLFPPSGQWARPATSHKLVLTGTTVALVLAKNLEKTRPGGLPIPTRPAGESETRRLLQSRFGGSRSPGKAGGCLTCYICRAVTFCTGRHRLPDANACGATRNRESGADLPSLLHRVPQPQGEDPFHEAGDLICRGTRLWGGVVHPGRSLCGWS
jgi:hypothetical protein